MGLGGVAWGGVGWDGLEFSEVRKGSYENQINQLCKLVGNLTELISIGKSIR